MQLPDDGVGDLLAAGLPAKVAGEVLALPADATASFGLEGVVSPLRLRGFAALLARVQRQVAAGVAGIG